MACYGEFWGGIFEKLGGRFALASPVQILRNSFPLAMPPRDLHPRSWKIVI